MYTKWQCCLNLQFKTKIKECHLLNGLRIMRCDEAHFHLDGVVNKQNVQFWASQNLHVIHEKVHHALRITVGRHLKSLTARSNLLWRDSEQWAPLKHVVQYFCVSPSYCRFAVTNSAVHAGWSQAACSECSFGLSAWYFRLVCHLKPIFWSFHIWTELPWNSRDLNPCDCYLWGFRKEKIFLKKLQTVEELRAPIIQAYNEITEDICHQVIKITVRVEEVARRNGGHIEPLIHRV
jgi:hypothetical protein